jgi:hypothetical protein
MHSASSAVSALPFLPLLPSSVLVGFAVPIGCMLRLFGERVPRFSYGVGE